MDIADIKFIVEKLVNSIYLSPGNSTYCYISESVVRLLNEKFEDGIISKVVSQYQDIFSYYGIMVGTMDTVSGRSGVVCILYNQRPLLFNVSLAYVR